MVGRCTVSAYWHATPALPVTVAVVRHVCPLPALQHYHAHAPWEHTSLAARLSQRRLSLHLRPRSPQRATRHVAALEPSRMERPGREPWVT
jgi:hypothetical protein